MRIIAGSKRGMKLLSPKTEVSRPIIDRVKESLFNVLYQYGLPSGRIVGDLFCGVGSLGLEALSRGAAFVTFVEQNEKVAAILNRNIEKAGFGKESKVIRADALKVGAPAGVNQEKNDVIFVDPPFDWTRDVGSDSRLSSLLTLLLEQVVPDGFVVVRTHRRVFLLERYDWFEAIERRQWGTSAITILQQVNE